MDYAILKTGSKQYRVKPGDVIDVEKLSVEEGSYIELSDVLAVSRDGELTLGNPLVPDASVLAQVRAHAKDKKVIVFKYKRKVRYRRKKGHRQPYTRLAITAIVLGEEEMVVQKRTEPEVTVHEELLVEEVVDEIEDKPIDDLDDELSDEPEDEIIDLPEDEVVNGAQHEIEDQAQDGGER